MFVRGSRLLLPAGFRMEWSTTPRPAQPASEGHMELTLKTTKPAYQEGEAIPLNLELKNMSGRSWIVTADLESITVRIAEPSGRALKLLLVRPQAAAVKTVCELPPGGALNGRSVGTIFTPGPMRRSFDDVTANVPTTSVDNDTSSVDGLARCRPPPYGVTSWLLRTNRNIS